ncbi:hypothetical protein [Paraburkholderia aromaticivorans]|uniref:hypothetical protein n=1 Tax=Paraburkholderia aromaticivorans TaxID=2026199 RepID=UPI0038BCCC87
MATDIKALTQKIAKAVQQWGKVEVEDEDSLLLEHEDSGLAIGFLIESRSEHFDLFEVLVFASELFEVLDDEKERARVSTILNYYNANETKGKVYINDENVVVVECACMSKGEDILADGYLVTAIFGVAELASDVQFRLNHDKPEGDYSRPLLNVRKH